MGRVSNNKKTRRALLDCTNKNKVLGLEYFLLLMLGRYQTQGGFYFGNKTGFFELQ
jgi:hypothetical protein